jgi:hypothetical protein
MGGSGDRLAPPVGDDEAGGAQSAAAARRGALEPGAAGDIQVGFRDVVDLDADGDAAELLGAGADRGDAEAGGVGAADQQHDLAGALVITGAARAGQLAAKLDQVTAERRLRLDAGGACACAEDDRHSAGGAGRNTLAAG